MKVERPSLQRGDGLQHHLSPTYNTVLSSIPKKLIDFASNKKNKQTKDGPLLAVWGSSITFAQLNGI